MTANDKSLETIQTKFDGISTTIKNQLSFNKILETQHAQLVAATPTVDIGKIQGQPEFSLESVNAVTARWWKPPRKTPYSIYIEKLTRPKRGKWGELATSVGGDTRTPMISCSIYDCYFE